MNQLALCLRTARTIKAANDGLLEAAGLHNNLYVRILLCYLFDRVEEPGTRPSGGLRTFAVLEYQLAALWNESTVTICGF